MYSTKQIKIDGLADIPYYTLAGSYTLKDSMHLFRDMT